jgi:hypothetical protein
VNAYRNIGPLAMYDGIPADIREGMLLWIRIALLFITAVIIPLFSPRKYVPVNPKVCLYLLDLKMSNDGRIQGTGGGSKS